jgi:hypothetical protein
MIKLQMYEVTFRVGQSNYKYSQYSKPCDYWRSHQYVKHLLAKDLDEVINVWPEILKKEFPVEDGTGGSHYYEDPVFGDLFKFVSIKLVKESILLNDKVTT